MHSANSVLEKNLYRLVNTLVLSCIVIFNVGDYLGIFNPRIWYIAVLFGIVLAIFCVVYFFASQRLITLFSVIAIIFVVCIIAGLSNVHAFVSNYIKWASGAHGWRQDWIFGYQCIQALWIVILLYALQLVFEKFFYIKLFVAIALVAMLAYYLHLDKDVSYVGVAFSFCFIALLFIEWTERCWKKEKQRTITTYMLWMVPFLVIYLVLMLRLPVSKEPYQWKYLKAAASYCEEKFLMMMDDIFGDEDEYDLSLSGFSDRAGLGEGVAEDNKEIMTVHSNKVMQSNLYLTGKHFNSFENMTWEAHQTEGAYDRYIDTLETIYAITKYDPDYKYKYMQSADLEICYKDLNTRYMFAPLKTYSYNQDSEEIKFVVGEGSTFFNKSKNYGFNYETDYYQLNLASDSFYGFLKTDIEYDEEIWNKTLRDFKNQTKIDLTYEDIETYKTRCYEEYTEAPALSKNVSDYLNSVTGNCETDIEKLWAIDAELSGYSYTKQPQNLPDKVVDATSFLDYFLLEAREGYCTYYATAFVLLARAEGFPARYVQGYCVPMNGLDEVTVLSSMAHAWPEVYIDDIGWIAFEPTPGYKEIRYTSWTTDKFEYSSNKYDDYYKQNAAETATLTDADEVENETYIHGVKRIINLICKIVFLLLVSMMLIICLITFVKKCIYKNKSIEEKYHIKVKRNIKLLGAFGMRISDTETLSDYNDRINDFFDNEIQLSFLNVHEEIIYGNKVIDYKLIENVDGQYKELLVCLKNKSLYKYIRYGFFRILCCDVG